MSSRAEQAPCPSCDAALPHAFFKCEKLPINCSAFWSTAEQAKTAPTGSLELACCSRCGLIFNRRFDAALLTYDPAYDNTLDHSPTFKAYTQELAATLCRRHELHRKRITEIGSGQATFLHLLSSAGNNSCIGFDPSFASIGSEFSAVQTVQALYPSRYADKPTDFVVCRHVLEHIPDAKGFLRNLNQSLAAQGEIGVYFEVPNASELFSGSSPWDIIYPHIYYFTARSLSFLFRRAGFSSIKTGTAFGGQYLWLEAKAGSRFAEQEVWYQPAIPFDNRSFQGRFELIADSWAALIRENLSAGRRLAFWGAGARGVTFLNTVPGCEHFEWIVDINPRKQGSYIPGTGQLVSAPAALAAGKPDTVVTLNPAYVTEIEATLREMDVHAEVLTLPPPAQRQEKIA